MTPLPITVPSPCRLCNAKRDVNEAMTFGTLCELCWCGDHPATNERRIKRALGKGSVNPADTPRDRCEIPNR